MITVELLGVPAVAGIVEFDSQVSGSASAGVNRTVTAVLSPELEMFRHIARLSCLRVDASGTGDIALAVSLAVLRKIVEIYPPAKVMPDGKIDRFGYVSILAEAIPGDRRESTNATVIVTSEALREPKYLTVKSWMDGLPTCFAAQELPLRLEVKFFGAAFYASDPRTGLIGALAHLVSEYLTRVQAESGG